jgi:polyadenylate-binding protein
MPLPLSRFPNSAIEPTFKSKFPQQFISKMSASFPQVIIHDLPPYITLEFLQNLFHFCCPAIHVHNIIIKWKINGRGTPITYAFVTLETQEDIMNVINEMNYTKLNGVPIRIVPADLETLAIVRSGKAKLFFKNLDHSIEESQLHEAFTQFGEVLSCKVARNKNGASLGYGYVQFRKEENAQEMLDESKGASIDGRPLTIELFQGRRHIVL